MIPVEFYTFNKRENSTKIPDVATAVVYQCVLKSPCSAMTPALELTFAVGHNPILYNYIKIPDFNRYYWVLDWTYNSGVWLASCEVDALASWKKEIGNSTEYVLRAASAAGSSIMDTMYPATTELRRERSEGVTPWWTRDMTSPDKVMYIIGVAGQTATSYYIFEHSNMLLFFKYLFSDDYANKLTENWATAYPQLKAQTNPLQYITTIMWFPFFGPLGTAVQTIKVGWVDAPAAAWEMPASGIAGGESIFSLRTHPQSSRGEYLNNNPYSSYVLFYPPWGRIELDPAVVANSSTVSAEWAVDMRTGMGTLIISGIKSGKLTTMSWIHSQVAQPYQISQIISPGYGLGNVIAPAAQLASTALSMGVGALLGGKVGAMLGGKAGGLLGGKSSGLSGAISSATSAIGDFASSKIPSVTTVGSYGGVNALRGLPALEYCWKIVVSEDKEHLGRPLCEKRVINSLSGLIQVEDPDISIRGTADENTRIKEYLASGFYYE